jgi:hypothetical protein
MDHRQHGRHAHHLWLPHNNLDNSLRRAGDVPGDTLRGEASYSLQANVKTQEGAQQPDRDAQLRYLNQQAREFRDGVQPVVSVDPKE